jgi:hypothetical protein
LAEYGPFYSRRRVAVSISAGRLNATLRVSIEPSFSVNRVTLPKGDFTGTLA